MALGADVNLVIRARDEASRVLAGVAKNTGSFASSIAAITSGTGALGAAALAVAAVGAAAVASAKALVDEAEATQRMSKATNVATDDLQAMSRIIQENGGDVTQFTNAMRTLNRAIQEGHPLLKANNVTAKDTFTAYRQLAASLSAAEDQGAALAVAQELLGTRNTALIADFPALLSGFDAQKQRLIDLGIVIEQDSLVALNKLDAEMEELARNWEAQTRRMTLATVPWATALLKAINNELIPSIETGRRIVRDVFGVGEMLSAHQFERTAGAKPRGSGRVTLEDMLNMTRTLRTHALDPSGQRAAAGVDVPTLGIARRGGVGRATFGDEESFVNDLQVGALDAVVADWSRSIAEITSAAGVAQATLEGVFGGINAAFQSLVNDVIAGGVKLGEVLTRAFRAMVAEILSSLARLAAAKVFQALISIAIPGLGPVIGALNTSAVGAGQPRISAGGAATELSRPGSVNVTIYANDARSFEDQHRSPFGGAHEFTRRQATSLGFA